MSRYGKYAMTKKVALALQAMVREPVRARFPSDGGVLHVRECDDRTSALIPHRNR